MAYTKMKDLLGTCCWQAVMKHSDGFILRTSGIEDIWRDRNATADDLMGCLDEWDSQHVQQFELQEWQKVATSGGGMRAGKKIAPVVIKTIEMAVSQ